MDRPRSLVQIQDAGLWMRSIQPLGCSLVAKHEERGRLPHWWERRPRSLAPIRLSGQGQPIKPPGWGCAAIWAAGFGLPPVHRLLQPARDDRELMLTVVAVNHLLDVVVVVALAFDVLPVADPVAAAGNGAGIGTAA